jgi:hypothetical protein
MIPLVFVLQHFVVAGHALTPLPPLPPAGRGEPTRPIRG